MPRSHFFKVLYNIILPSAPRSSKWSLSLFPAKPCTHFSCLPCVPYAPLISFFLYTRMTSNWLKPRKTKNLAPTWKHIPSTLVRSVIWRYNKLSHVFFNVLLTVHVSIILATDQLNAQILVFVKFVICLYMFRALLCSSSGGQIVLYSIWYRRHPRWPSGAQPAHRTATYGGIQTRNHNKRASVDLRLRPRGHWDRLNFNYRSTIL